MTVPMIVVGCDLVPPAAQTVVALPPAGSMGTGPPRLVQSGYFDAEWQLAESPVLARLRACPTLTAPLLQLAIVY